MAQGIKHVGRIKSTGRKCLIVFRTLPGDARSCLVVLTENLNPTYHDALMSLVSVEYFCKMRSSLQKYSTETFSQTARICFSHCMLKGY